MARLSSELTKVLREVEDERQRQDELVARNEIPFNLADPFVPPSIKVLVLTEEVGEVARAILEDTNTREELIQVAACAIAMAEGYPHE